MQQEIEDIDADNWDEKRLQEEWEKMKEWVYCLELLRKENKSHNTDLPTFRIFFR